jgi:hypothetical protein|tara:strand:- start:355 stop:636 length:282 start_codon:yes stop_codon:yes gene_type:complete
MKNDSDSWNIFNWLFFIVFVLIGGLNMIFVHLVPGAIYLLISLVYLPKTNTFLKKKFGFSIPIVLKLILAVLVLWFTLGLGDLMEIFEFWMYK